MKVKIKLFCIVLNVILVISFMNNVYAEDDTENIVHSDTIDIACYNPNTKEIEVKEYDFSSIPKVYPEENREPTVEIARPFWVVGPDDREYLKQMTTYPNRTICYIYVQNYNGDNPCIGSGVMIGRNTVLTSAHLLYNWDKKIVKNMKNGEQQ